jgi:hypothetical protein
MPRARVAITAMIFSAVLYADPINCDLVAYKGQPGLTVTVADNHLAVIWEGDRGAELLLTFAIENRAPVIRELAIRKKGGAWERLAADVTPEFTIVSGKRRMSHQQLEPLETRGVKITQEMIDQDKWEAFWDAPLDVPGIPANGRPAGGNLPLDLPRSASEIHRASASWNVTGCDVKTNGARLEIGFPGMELGVFTGRLQYTVYRGTNLIRQEAIARTSEQSVAYKYDSGLKGLSIGGASRVSWRDTADEWQEYRFGGAPNESEVPLKAINRLLIAERGTAGSIAVLTPPHTFFWAREIETNLGYNWYRKDSESTFSFGIRQAEKEEEAEYAGNFALYSAPPGSLQRMAVYFYPNTGNAQATAEQVLAFTHGDHFKPLAGYQVMAHHYHMDLGQRLRNSGSLDTKISDLAAIRAIGINIVSQIDSVFVGRPPGRGGRPDQLRTIADSVEGAHRNSDKGFLVMPDQEVYGSPLGGHTDLLFSHPVYWDEKQPGQSFVEDNPKYGKVYHVSGAPDFIEMARREDILISMPHPRTKGSTGYPDFIKDTDYFKDPHYQGVGFRWGMGLDLSDQRLCDHRCFALLDDMSNWQADLPTPPKYLTAITETRYKAPGDEVYAASPVNYVKLPSVPSYKDVSPVVKAMMNGDYFVTSGEVLIASSSIQGTGDQRRVVADLEWTFPLEFVEVVWGDGNHTDRKIVPATDLPPFGKHHFEISFNAKGQKWVRFAAWDSAGNGASAQPVKLARAN